MSKIIEKLTPAQEAKIPEYEKLYRAIGLSVGPCDRAKAEKAVTDMYAYQKMAAPKFIWFDSPKAGILAAAQIAKGSENVTAQEISEQAAKASYGSFNAHWVAFYSFIAKELPVTSDNLVDIANELIKECGVFWTFTDIVVMTEKPVAIHIKDGKLHNTRGLALEYKDGSGVFCIDGVRQPSLLAMTIESESKKSSL